jgi:hypothetical protein
LKVVWVQKGEFMQATKLLLRKKKMGCVFFGLMLFFLAMIVVAIANLITNFSFGSVIAAIFFFLIAGGLGYFLVLTTILNNPPVVTLNDNGIEIVGLGMVIKQSAAWSEVESVEAAYHDIQKQNMLTVKLFPPKAPIMVAESTVEDFGNFSAVIKAHFLAYQATVVKAALELTREMAKPEVQPARKSSKKQTGDVVFDREERIESPELGATFIYKIYNAPNAASAQAFLANTPVNDAHLYILVNTPEGTTYGRDVQGTYTQ